MLDQIRRLHLSTYLRAVPIALVATVVIGVPSDLIETPLFGRPVDTRPIDYVILVISSALVGLIFAIRAEPGDITTTGANSSGTDDPGPGDEPDEDSTPIWNVEPDEDSTPIWGGFVSFLAVGCPVCNQAVVALVGTSGALSWWAPVQPVVGLGAIGILIWALRRRLDTFELTACRLPAPASGSGPP